MRYLHERFLAPRKLRSLKELNCKIEDVPLALTDWITDDLLNWLVKSTIRKNPNIAVDEAARLNLPVMRTNYVALRFSKDKVIYKPTEDLLVDLNHTKLSCPVSYIELPYDTFMLDFCDTKDTQELQHMYVAESWTGMSPYKYEHYPKIANYPEGTLFRNLELVGYTSGGTNCNTFCIDSRLCDTLEEAVQRDAEVFATFGDPNTAEINEFYENFYARLFNFLIYLTSQDADILSASLPLSKRKLKALEKRHNNCKVEATKKDIHETIIKATHNVYIAGGYHKKQSCEGYSVEESSKGSRPRIKFLVSGHWHGYWVGSGNSKELVKKWLKPYFKCKDADVEEDGKIYHVA